MTKPMPRLAINMRIQIPRGVGLRFSGRYVTILQIKPKARPSTSETASS
ncbi:hypothetical protein AB9075_07210 [Burkholderia thailandensis]|nr:hypothetical protein [Burkholderia sp. AU28863]